MCFLFITILFSLIDVPLFRLFLYLIRISLDEDVRARQQLSEYEWKRHKATCKEMASQILCALVITMSMSLFTKFTREHTTLHAHTWRSQSNGAFDSNLLDSNSKSAKNIWEVEWQNVQLTEAPPAHNGPAIVSWVMIAVRLSCVRS